MTFVLTFTIYGRFSFDIFLTVSDSSLSLGVVAIQTRDLALNTRARQFCGNDTCSYIQFTTVIWQISWNYFQKVSKNWIVYSSLMNRIHSWLHLCSRLSRVQLMVLVSLADCSSGDAWPRSLRVGDSWSSIKVVTGRLQIVPCVAQLWVVSDLLRRWTQVFCIRCTRIL